MKLNVDEHIVEGVVRYVIEHPDCSDEELSANLPYSSQDIMVAMAYLIGKGSIEYKESFLSGRILYRPLVKSAEDVPEGEVAVEPPSPLDGLWEPGEDTLTPKGKPLFPGDHFLVSSDGTWTARVQPDGGVEISASGSSFSDEFIHASDFPLFVQQMIALWREAKRHYGDGWGEPEPTEPAAVPVALPEHVE